MNKKTLLKKLNNIKPVLVAIVLLVGLSFVNAVPWTAPTGSNTSAPIDEGTPNQEKIGQLTVGALANSAHGPVVTFSPFRAGSASLDVTSNFYGPLNLFGVFDSSATADMPLCTDSNGKVKLCSDKILFAPVSSVYYSPTLTTSQTVSFPSGGVTGAVTYSIDSAYSCTTVQAKDAITNNTTTDTTWPNGTTLTGSNSSYNVTFNRWGSFILGITCTNGKSYTATIDIKGKIKPVNGWSVQKFTFTSNRQLEIKAQGGGGGPSSYYNNGYSCAMSSGGGPAYAHITTASTWTPNSGNYRSYLAPFYGKYDSGANTVHAGGGYATDELYSSGCRGDGGSYTTYSSSATSVTVRNGATAKGSSGGCPGSSPASCDPKYQDGSGGYGNIGGGGGSYVSLKHAINSGENLFVLNAPSSYAGTYNLNSPKPASLIIEWK